MTRDCYPQSTLDDSIPQGITGYPELIDFRESWIKRRSVCSVAQSFCTGLHTHTQQFADHGPELLNYDTHDYITHVTFLKCTNMELEKPPFTNLPVSPGAFRTNGVTNHIVPHIGSSSHIARPLLTSVPPAHRFRILQSVCDLKQRNVGACL